MAMLTKLKIYAGAEHPHQAQQPEPTELASQANVATHLAPGQ